MKKIILITFVLSNVYLLANSQIKVSVDERFELTSTVFRLAEAKEFSDNYLADYTAKIDKYFALYKKHQLIDFIKKIRDENGIGFDAVSNITSFLLIKNNKIIVNPDADLADLYKHDSRWNKEIAEKFIVFLNLFYKETKFDNFYKNNETFYNSATEQMLKLTCKIDTDWFGTFFGKKLTNANIIVSMTNGASNYSSTVSLKSGSKIINVIIGCSSTDDKNIPIFSQYSDIPTIIHEICHHFVNPIVDKNMNELMPYAQKIFPFVKDRLDKYAYRSDTTMLYENFVRLAVNLYPDNIFDKYNLLDDEIAGFVWMTNQKNFYKSKGIWWTCTFEEFMPQLIDYWAYLSGNIETELIEFKAKTPRVVSVFPANNSVVDADFTGEIQVKFSVPMRKDVLGVNENKQDTALLFPNTMGAHWEDEFTFIIPVNLENGKNYGLKLPSSFFESSYNYKMRENFYINFKTKE